MANPGDTYVLPKSEGEKEHLWVILTSPDPDTGESIMVNLTTQQPHSDSTTVLFPGDHPFIGHPTVVFYADARLVKTSLLDILVSKGEFRQHAAFSPEVLSRIQSGVLQSPFTPRKIKAAFESAQSR